MATVRMADKRVDDIVRRAKRKYEEINKPMEADTTLADNLFSDTFSSQLKLYYQFMLDNFPTIEVRQTSVDSITLEYFEPSDREGEEDSLIDSTRSVDLSVEQKVPSAFVTKYGSLRIRVELNDPCLQNAIQVNNFNNDLNDKTWTYEREVRDLCYEFKTLNQALKHMPALEKLCDPDDIARVHEKVDRNKAEEIMQDAVDEKGQQLKEVLLETSLLGDNNG